MNNIVHAAALRAAANAVDQLTDAGSKVLGHYSNGRKPVILIDKAPAFVTGAMRYRAPDANGGIDRVMAAPYHGCQIEWREHERAVQEVARG